jgi:hypothetical protein
MSFHAGAITGTIRLDVAPLASDKRKAAAKARRRKHKAGLRKTTKRGNDGAAAGADHKDEGDAAADHPPEALRPAAEGYQAGGIGLGWCIGQRLAHDAGLDQVAPTG